MQLRIATLNVWGLPFGIARDTARRMAAIGAALPALKADVVAFQEVWTPESRSALVVAGEACGLRHVWHRSAAFGGSGLLVLSRLPIERARFHPFSLKGRPERIQHGDYWGAKGLVEVTLQTEIGPVALLVTHLHARYGAAGDFDEYLGDRVGQVVEVAQVTQRNEDPLVAVGDFNFEEGGVEYDLIAELAGLRDTAADLDTRQDTILSDSPYRSQEQSSERIDYVFVRSGDRVSAHATTLTRAFVEAPPDGFAAPAYSDHAGLLATLEFEASPSSRQAPSDRAIEQAQTLLADAQTRSRERRNHTRLAGFASAGTALAGLAGSSALRRTRRNLLGNLAAAIAGAAGLTGLGLFAISEFALANEDAAYERLRESLRNLRAAPKEPEKV